MSSEIQETREEDKGKAVYIPAMAIIDGLTKEVAELKRTVADLGKRSGNA